ncbi:hypothetical protein C2E23DRAFT_836259 [Lenzites betulinus]|nr:hypothetical protein C2E23DRAFT_836259 [Lenzites betulinus]
MENFDAKGKEKATDDAFFLERLEMLYEQNLADLRIFADREERSFDEVRKRMAELHSKYLFGSSGLASPQTDGKELTRRVLLDVSRNLESLETLAGLQSFFLVVDPSAQEDNGFLGGTIAGREFWRGHRGCGSAGAQMFKAQCTRSAHMSQRPTYPQPVAIDPMLLPRPAPTSPPTVEAKGSARELKTELYAAMRDALRAASGVRTAEMKWTNHSKLSVYGVRISGWPEAIPSQNPSTLSVTQNKKLLEMLNAGDICFVRLDATARTSDEAHEQHVQSPMRDEEAMFEDSIDYSWAYREDASNPHQQQPSTASFIDHSTWTDGQATDNASHAAPTTPKKRRLEI